MPQGKAARPALKTLRSTASVLTNDTPVLESPADSWRADKRGANARGYTYRWQKAREQFLRQHPLCQCPECDEGRLRVKPATVVDHRTPHRGDQALFWDPLNWMAMAEECHNAKTQRERAAQQGGGGGSRKLSGPAL